MDGNAISGPAAGRRAVAAAAAYIGLMAVGMAVMHHGFGYAYTQPEMVRVIGPVQLVLAAWAIQAARRQGGWRQVGFGRLDRRALWWLLPFAAPLAVGLASLAGGLARLGPQLDPGRWALLALVAGTTGLVGFAEELMFRGVLLHGAWRGGGLFRAMATSAVGFSLLHAVNLLGGAPAPAVGIQLLTTLVFGLAFAPIAVKLGSLWPLIVLHGLWDFMLLAHQVLPLEPPLTVVLMTPLLLACAPVLWWSLRSRRRLRMEG
jgi:membrane protease YdiL (CAAX protease family)